MQEPETIYIAPDIRNQTIEDAEAFISKKRVKRLIMYQKLQTIRAEKAGKARDGENQRFIKRAEMVESALSKIEDSIFRAEAQLEKLRDINSSLTNIENEIDNTPKL